jgi:hypothetical protein
MLEILTENHVQISLPKTFNSETMYGFLSQALTPEGNIRYRTIDFDFGDLDFIEPVGVVVLSNLVEFLRRAGVTGFFRSVWGDGTQSSKGVRYLDDSGFFERYHNGKSLRTNASCKKGTLPLTLVPSLDTFKFLNSTMIPWIAETLETSVEALATVRVCLEEVLQNVSDHSGVDVGCVHAQFFPDHGTLEIAISDFGFGIPHKVREYGAKGESSAQFVIASTISDADALKLACKQGFTTKSNVRNRGAGLPNLLLVVTGRDRGHVWIVSGQAVVSAVHRNGISKVTARTKTAVYPGTLVRVILKANVVKDFEKDIEQQEFSWT